jgi:hypothetical protein
MLLTFIGLLQEIVSVSRPLSICPLALSTHIFLPDSAIVAMMDRLVKVESQLETSNRLSSLALAAVQQ